MNSEPLLSRADRLKKAKEEAERIDQQFDALHLALGKLSNYFTHLEIELKDTLCKFALDDETKKELSTGQMIYSKKLKLLRTLHKDARVSIHYSDQIDMDSLIEKLKVAGDKRNDALHSAWNATHLEGSIMDIARNPNAFYKQAIERKMNRVDQQKTSLEEDPANEIKKSCDFIHDTLCDLVIAHPFESDTH